ncbi:tetratricopeptide repeat-containing sensor histidine kinase [Chitinophaga filiformis]|uniref:ATP-binding protein n=1 Tax=Chitinophaga filiformis TaxID=104663 RepID=UPI001F2D2EAE|nr:tetratricopeptide repeat-containing sensor histidine kinase [Chitinophaga filiformis]MCF6403932.1 tetratricopeptide repeat-containing sensor histidine kinase [Chitinophaga filiformis]
MIVISGSFLRQGAVFAQKGVISRLQADTLTTDSTRYVDLMNQLAGQFQHRQLDTCFLYLCKAREVAQRLGYASGEAAAYRGLGSYYTYRDNSYLSFRFYLDALNLYKELEDSAGICQTSMHLGVYYQFEKQYDEAGAYMKRALDISKRLKNDSLLMVLRANYYFMYVSNLRAGRSSDFVDRKRANRALAIARQRAVRMGDERLLFYTGMLQAQELIYSKTAEAEGVAKLTALVADAERKGYVYHAMYGSSHLASYKARSHHADSLIFQRQMVRLALEGGFRELALPVVAKLYAWYDNHNMSDSASFYGSVMLDIVEKEEQSKTQGELDYIDYYMQEKKLRALQLQHDYQQQLLDKKAMEIRGRYAVIIFLTILLILTVLLLVDVNRSHRRSRRNAIQLGQKNREISEKNALLRTNDDFKNKLISLIAHDFRVPLNHIIDITDLLKDQSLEYDEAISLFRKLETKSQHTLHVFDSILRWIRSQLSGFVYAPVVCRPADMIREALEILKDNCKEKALTIRLDVSDDLQLLADREMLQFVHRNLLHNAVKFSPAQGTLHITAVVEGDKGTISFSDEGRGVDPAVLQYLFEYRNREKDRGRTNGGAGLALIICKDFMDKMGGTIQAINNPGNGSTFSYTLPLVKEGTIQEQ